jgi:hypothetical protein
MLPTPVTTQDEYLAALLEEIKGLRSDLVAAQRTPAEDGLVDLREALVSVKGIGETRADEVIQKLQAAPVAKKPRHRDAMGG